MRVLRSRQRRAFPVAIMMIAALAVVWHGAMSLIAHPLAASSVTQLAAVLGHDGHGHTRDGGLGDYHATHDHGKSKSGSKSGDDCCSTVSAVTLPVSTSSEVARLTVRLVRRLGADGGTGIDPSTPAEPPSTAYQS